MVLTVWLLYPILTSNFKGKFDVNGTKSVKIRKLATFLAKGVRRHVEYSQYAAQT